MTFGQRAFESSVCFPCEFYRVFLVSEPDKGVAQIYLCDADIDVISQGPSEDGGRGQDASPLPYLSPNS